MLHSLRHRDFRFLLLTSFLSASARNLQQVSLGFLAFNLTDSSVLLGTVLFVYQIPFLLFALPLGALTDRVNRKTLLAWSQFAMATVAVVLVVDIAVGTVAPWHLLVFAFISGVENTLIHIVRQTLVPSVVPKSMLLNAVSLNTAGFNISCVAAPVVGGALIVAIGVAGSFGLQAALLALVALSAIPMRVGKALDQPEQLATGPRSMASDVVEAVHFMWRKRILRELFLIEYVALLFTVPYLTFMPVWVDEVLHGDAGMLGLLYGASGMGAVMGAIWLAQQGGGERRGLWIWGPLIAHAVALIALSAATSLLATLAALGVPNACYFSVLLSTAQAAIPDRLQGRAMAIWNMGSGAIAIGSLAMGYLVAQTGIRNAMWLTGAAMLVVALLGAAFLAESRSMKGGAASRRALMRQ